MLALGEIAVEVRQLCFALEFADLAVFVSIAAKLSIHEEFAIVLLSLIPDNLVDPNWIEYDLFLLRMLFRYHDLVILDQYDANSRVSGEQLHYSVTVFLREVLNNDFRDVTGWAKYAVILLLRVDGSCVEIFGQIEDCLLATRSTCTSYFVVSESHLILTSSQKVHRLCCHLLLTVHADSSWQVLYFLGVLKRFEEEELDAPQYQPRIVAVPSLFEFLDWQAILFSKLKKVLDC